jgi:hypothetical protein
MMGFEMKQVVMGILVVMTEMMTNSGNARLVYMYAVSSEVFVAVASLVRDKIRS